MKFIDDLSTFALEDFNNRVGQTALNSLGKTAKFSGQFTPLKIRIL